MSGTTKNQQGFTIIELMIASMVFSVILLITTAGLLQVGKTYYKGVTQSRTQGVARTVMDDVTAHVQFSGEAITVTPQAAPGVVGVYCLGNTRYTYVRDRQLTDGVPKAGEQTNQALLVDRVAGGCSTGTPHTGACTPSSVLANNCQELLSPGMRLTNFKVEDKSNKLFHIVVGIVSGENDILDASHTKCASAQAGTQFCAVSNLDTYVQKRI